MRLQSIQPPSHLKEHGGCLDFLLLVCAVINFWATRNTLEESLARLSVMQNLHLYRVILNLVRTTFLRHASLYQQYNNVSKF